MAIDSVQITEVELNPAGADSGEEWIEIYSPSEINLSEYHLVNNDGNTYKLNGTFSGYITIYFNNQWLDNSDEKIFLKKSDEIISITPILEDNKNTDQTWAFCDSGWVFGSSTKNRENSCSQPEEETPNTPSNQPSEPDNIIINTSSETQNNIISDNQFSQDQVTDNSPSAQDNSKSPIILSSDSKSNTQSSNSERNTITTKQEKIRLGIILGFTILTVFLLILLALKRL